MAENTERKPSVFLSYARDDDEPFVEMLHKQLCDAGINVWWDRKSMSSRGRSFLQELRDAIDSVDRVIAVIGPHAINSQYVLAEWQHALLFGTPIVPVLREGNFDQVSPEISKNHGINMSAGVDMDMALADLVRLLREPVALLGDFKSPVPALPAFFYPRDELLRAIHDGLLRDIEHPEVVSHTELVLVLDGLGGIGKSVTAAAFCRLAQTRRAVPEGIFWIDVGEDAQPLAIVRQLSRLLGADLSLYNDLSYASAQLPGLLTGRRCLIVLDDVWDLAVVKPMLNALAPQTRLLVTTRMADLLPGRPALSVSQLEISASLRLLSEYSGEPLEKLPRIAESVAEHCGGMPFAVALCGAMRRDNGITWDDLNEALEEADLGYLEYRFPNYEQHTNLLSCLEVSFRALGEKLARLFKELVVVADAAAIPETAVTTLWTRDGESERMVRKWLGQLAAKALVRLEGEPTKRHIIIHSLVRDYLRAMVDPSVQTELHRQMLNAYERKCPQGWSSGPQDGYFHENLCRHLIKGERIDDLRELLQSFTWLQARLIATDPLGLLSDYRFLCADDELLTIAEALRLSFAGLAIDPNQLPGQLLGRLNELDTISARKVCDEARAYNEGPWLEPRIAPLRCPGDPLLYSFNSHRKSVYAAAMTPDGSRAVTGDEDGIIIQWDLQLGFATRAMRAYETRVWSLAIQSDGTRAVAAYGEQGLLVWRLGDGKVERKANLDGGDMRTVTFSADAQLIVAGLATGLFVWDLERDRYAVLTREESDATSAIALSPDGVHAAVATAKGGVEIWNMQNLSRMYRVPASQDAVRSVYFHNNGQQVLSLGDDYSVRLWDVATGTELDHWSTRSYILGVAPQPTAEWLYTGDVDGNLEIHSLDHTIYHTVTSAHRTPVRAVVANADATVVLTTADDGEVRVWNASRLKTASERANHLGIVDGVALRQDGLVLASASTGGDVRLWNRDEPHEPRIYTGHDEQSVRAVAFSADGLMAASSDANGQVAIWDPNTLQTKRLLHIHGATVIGRHTEKGMNIELTFGGGVYLGFSTDGKRLLAGGADGTLARIELDQDGEGFCFNLGEGGPWVHSASPDAHMAVSVNDKGAPICFDVNNGKGGVLSEGLDEFVTALTASKNGHHILCAYANGALRGWDMTAGTKPNISAEGFGSGEAAMYDIHTGRRRMISGRASNFYSDIALTADNHFGVFVTNTGLLLVRDLATWAPLVSFLCDVELYSCAVSADGRWIAAGGQNSVYLFKLNGLPLPP